MRKKMWVCPECRRNRWTCEDLGPEADRGHGHNGWAMDRGQKRPPPCVRHPRAIMVLDYVQ